MAPIPYYFFVAFFFADWSFPTVYLFLIGRFQIHSFIHIIRSLFIYLLLEFYFFSAVVVA